MQYLCAFCGIPDTPRLAIWIWSFSDGLIYNMTSSFNPSNAKVCLFKKEWIFGSSRALSNLWWKDRAGDLGCVVAPRNKFIGGEIPNCIWYVQVVPYCNVAKKCIFWAARNGAFAEWARLSDIFWTEKYVCVRTFFSWPKAWNWGSNWETARGQKFESRSPFAMHIRELGFCSLKKKNRSRFNEIKNVGKRQREKWFVLARKEKNSLKWSRNSSHRVWAGWYVTKQCPKM